METVRLPNVTTNDPTHPGRDASRYTLIVPARLVAAERAELRRAAIELIERAAAAHASTITVDLRATTEIDASGLGSLVLVHKRAKERGITTRLLQPGDAVTRMLALTRLEYLFSADD